MLFISACVYLILRSDKEYIPKPERIFDSTLKLAVSKSIILILEFQSNPIN